MEMCFHGNRVSWGINHSFISLYSKYQPPSFICSSIMLAPVISSLDEIYCILISSKSLPLPTLTILRLEWILSYCKECTGYGEITICWHGECNPHFIGSWAGSAMFKAYKAFGQGKWGHVSLFMPKISLNLMNGPLLTYTKSSAKKLLACI